MKLSKEKLNTILYIAIFAATILAFIITITVKTNLDAIKKKLVYILMYCIFVLICILPFICTFAIAFKHKDINKDNIVVVCILTILTVVIAIFVYGDGSTVPNGTNNIFQYAITKLYKQHFRYAQIFLFGAAAFCQLISALSFKSKPIKKQELILQFALMALYLVALGVNILLSIIYWNYVQAVTTFVCNLFVVGIGVVLTVFVLKNK
ncbi:MAG: hypothetical protein E7370_05465 [Clostridiales bacterium]|nr:hypothetical protein [Clostridiales bacterium]